MPHLGPDSRVQKDLRNLTTYAAVGALLAFGIGFIGGMLYASQAVHARYEPIIHTLTAELSATEAR